MKEIYLAGGCFWGVEQYFRNIKGVLSTSVGYANGDTEETSYEKLKLTNHAEVVYVQYDPCVVGLEFLLEMYYRVIDPLSVNKQGEDEGTQYRTGIYYVDDRSVDVINQSILKLEENLGCKVAIEVELLKNYILAEDYHQNYLINNPNGYCHIQKIDFEYASNVNPVREK